MGAVDRAVYRPDPAAVVAYDELYAEYLALHDWFGRGGNDVMHRLKARRRAVRSGPAVRPDPAGEVEAPALEGAGATGTGR
jgi:L-ribulokinase